MAFRNEKIRPAYHNHEYTAEQVREISLCMGNPIYFIENYVYIQHPTQGSVPFHLWDFQKNLIQVYSNHDRVIALLSRQVGKTATAAAFLLWWVCFNRDQQILVASKDHDGAKDILGRLWYAYEELPLWIKPGTKTNQKHTKEFDNNSKIFATATTETSGRGKSNSLIYLDEFAFVRPGIANEFWTSIYPTIASGGKCIITSTPNTDEDKFASIWFNCDMSPLSDSWRDLFADRQKVVETEDDEEDYEIFYETDDAKRLYGIGEEEISIEGDDTLDGFIGFHAHWTRCPDGKGGHRDERFKRQTLLSGVTEEEWLREFECCFVSGDSTLISATKLATLRKTVRKPRFIDKWGCRWYEEVKPNAAYGVVLDPSEGVGLDDACIQVWEIPRMKQVAEWSSNMVDQTEQTKMLRRTLMRIYMIQQNDPDHDGGVDIYYSVERNGLGIGILQTIEMSDERTFPGFLIDSTTTSSNVRGSGYRDKPGRWRGLLTSVTTKNRYAVELKNLIERNLFIPRSKHLASQLKTFVKKGRNSWCAKEGSKDDIVMSCVLMCFLIDEIRYHEPDLDDMITPELEDHYDPDDPNDPLNEPMLPIL